MLRRPAGWLADRDPLPTAVRAVVGYYARTGVFDPRSLPLKRRVDAVVEEMVEVAFEKVEAAIAEQLDCGPVELSYDTKLLLPAKLTLGYLYRREDERRDRAEALTALVVAALLDGDMRDAIADEEYGDFELSAPDGAEQTGVEISEADRRRAAETAQATLQSRVERGLEEYPEGVREAYERTVAISERHQRADPRFRALMIAATDGTTEAEQEVQIAAPKGADSLPDAAVDSPEHARERIAGEYRHGVFEDPPELFGAEHRELPYFKTQYNRVGVIYRGMIEMYRAAGFAIDDSFQRSIVLAIVGAQIWLDDVDDYRADAAAGQLTPVTAEYLLTDEPAAAKRRVRAIGETYL
ncbi:hypothetical protein BRC62_05445, partial [Halobacteriales archaeon QH_10_67_13]